MIESLLLTTVPVQTFNQQVALTNASGFFFQRDEKLFLVTSKHVLLDKPSSHFPDRIEIEIHINPENLATSTRFSIPLYDDGRSIWRQGVDSAGAIDVAVIEIDQSMLPPDSTYAAFTPSHMHDSVENISIGSPMLVVGFPLGFHDTLHHLPIVREAINASSFSLRFQGNGYFLTDARTHRGMSGAPVVMRASSNRGKIRSFPWLLLGIHSARLDVGPRDVEMDEVLGLNCTWFADILLTLTDR
jgi:S1-C subfamily serine protease